MSESFIRLYADGDEPTDAYLLAEGECVFFVSEGDKYTIKGKNIILGGSEVILSKSLNVHTLRLETALIDSTAKVKRIPAERFLEGLSQVSFLLNVAMVLAKQVSLTNLIIARYEKTLHGKKNDRRQVCLEYYNIVRDLKASNAKRVLPWLKEMIVKYETSLVFREGEAMSRTAEPIRISGGTQLSDKMMEFPLGSHLCEEGEEGNEMYILQSGMIDVVVKGTVVATYSEPGTPIGEMALLIGEKRTATLKAKNNVVVTRIRKDEIKEVAEREISIIQSVAHSLAKKQYQNVCRIKDLTEKSIEKEIFSDGGKDALKFAAVATELSSLRNALSELVFKKNEPFLKEIADRYAID
ncbi:MAG TPA: cyclic nucleotide-binding domain-containing protein [Spirochaetota bacterium]